MKKILFALSALCMVVLLCTSCFPVYLQMGGEVVPKTFEKDGITLNLTSEFVERESQMGFDAYYTSKDCGVMVMKEPFTLEEGLEQQSLEDYIAGVIENNGHENKEAIRDGELLYYSTDKVLQGQDVRYYSFVYKGTDAFWIVQFGCTLADHATMEPIIFDWARGVTVN